ncbi:MAG TPA: cytochrome c [Acidimicrobiales bacterium]|nr:cytochrome c [Acidimicrobiales bacterium]
MTRWHLSARSSLLLLVPLLVALTAVAFSRPPSARAAQPETTEQEPTQQEPTEPESTEPEIGEPESTETEIGEPAATRSKSQAIEAELGARLYQRDCVFCHGADGRGTSRGQSLTEVGPAEAHYSITTGRMPIQAAGEERRRREVQYKAEEVDALIAHMRRFLASEPEIPEVNIEEGKLSEGAELFLAECAACHQWSGNGGALLGREAPSLFESTPTQIAAAIRTGPPGMPGYSEEVIDEEQLNSVVKYVLYLRQPQDEGGNGLWHLGPFAEGLIAWVVGIGVLILAVLWIGERGTGEPVSTPPASEEGGATS